MELIDYATYSYGFGIMKLNKLLNIAELNNLESETYSLFLHEYIHYYQDRTTTFGMKYSGYVWKQMNASIYYVQNYECDTYPIRIRNEEFENATKLRDVFEFLLGDYDDITYVEYDEIEICNIDYKYDETIESIRAEEMADLDFVRVPQVKLKLTNGGKVEEKVISFGAMIIMECMASIIERHYFNKKSSKKSIQYNFVEILIDNMCPVIGSSNKLVVAFCDACLMYSNPGLVMYMSLWLIKKDDIEIKSTKDIYDIIYKHNEPNYLDEYKKYYDILIESIDNFLDTDDKELYPVGINIKNQYENIKRRFNHEKRWILIEKMLNEDLSLAKKFMELIIKNVGSPIITTQDGKVWSSFTDDSSTEGIIIGLQELYNLMTTSQEECSLRWLCDKDINTVVDPNACSKPLYNICESNKCLMSFLLKKWGII